MDYNILITFLQEKQYLTDLEKDILDTWNELQKNPFDRSAAQRQVLQNDGSLDAFYPTTDPKLFYQSIRRIRKYNIKKVLPGHHQLDIPVSLIADIEAGFAQLERAGKLKQGNGLFKFQDFQIHI